MARMTVYEAIAHMRRNTADGTPFSLTFSTWDTQRHKSSGIKTIKQAVLRPAAKASDLENADYKLFIYDIEKQKDLICWQPLLMFYNGNKLKL